jgi:hypothetical protein
MSRPRFLDVEYNAKQLMMVAADSVANKLLVGANQIGKTAFGAFESIFHSWGCRPIFPPDHPFFRVLNTRGEPIRVPNRGQIGGEDFPTAYLENIMPTLRDWFPPETWVAQREERGVPRILLVDVSWVPWADKTSPDYPYSPIYCHAFEQGRAAFQGHRSDWTWLDEVPPWPVYVEVQRGLATRQGKLFGGMSIVDGRHAWVYGQFLPGGKPCADHLLVEGAMVDNLMRENGKGGGLTMEAIERFRKKLRSKREIEVRIEGKRLILQGTLYGATWDEKINVVPERARDPYAVHVLCCDAHPTKPYAMVWFEVNEHNEWHAWAECYDGTLNSVKKIANHIKKVEWWRTNKAGRWVENSGMLQPSLRLIDPLASTANKGTGFSDIQDFALNHGIYWTKWRRGDLEKRVREVNEWLEPRPPFGRPRLTVAESCEQLIGQMPTARENLPKDPTITARSGKILDVELDLVQCVIAAVNSGMTYEALRQLRPSVPEEVEDVYVARGNYRQRHYRASRPVESTKELWG